MDRLKLMALDEDDLAVISACLQDAVFKVGDLSFSARSGLFSLAANRFVWEEGRDKKTFERRRALLVIKQVHSVRSLGAKPKDSETVHSLLALRYLPGEEAPAGTIELVLSGGAVIQLDVACIEVQLADVGGGWETKFRPRHPLGG